MNEKSSNKYQIDNKIFNKKIALINKKIKKLKKKRKSLKIKKKEQRIEYLNKKDNANFTTESHVRFLKNKLSSVYKTQWTTIKDAEQWAIDAFEKGVSENKTVEMKINELINKTRCIFPYTTEGNADFITILWSASKMLIPYNTTASLACLNEIHKIANTNYLTAISLLRSQTNEDIIIDESASPMTVSIKFSPNCNQYIIESVIHMLKAERNNHNKVATAILDNFATKDYPPIVKHFMSDD